MNKVYVGINEWFKTNLLSLTYKNSLPTENSQENTVNISYSSKHITNIFKH